MKAYLDITLLPNDDIGHHFLWGKVFQQVHLALVENKNTDGSSSVGVAFPEFNAEKHRLGRKLRLFAPNSSDLEKLSIARWLDRLADYVHITSVRETPQRVEQYACFSRLRTKYSRERLARRAMKRHGLTYEQALQERKNFQPQWTDAPFIQLKSLGNDHSFRLFIGMEEKGSSGEYSTGFNTYGLSKGTALPKF
ncbi:MAG: type I-F CRISPR-associated endoribonuclease Cas6/Csy4 [Gammaproteobacteria bacterium]|nr:type I-F CRISPR-associated endoribonuclease Cas6/Csy4 [Gammaproteobacteria bacterium]